MKSWDLLFFGVCSIYIDIGVDIQGKIQTLEFYFYFLAVGFEIFFLLIVLKVENFFSMRWCCWAPTNIWILCCCHFEIFHQFQIESTALFCFNFFFFSKILSDAKKGQEKSSYNLFLLLAAVILTSVKLASDLVFFVLFVSHDFGSIFFSWETNTMVFWWWIYASWPFLSCLDF